MPWPDDQCGADTRATTAQGPRDLEALVALAGALGPDFDILELTAVLSEQAVGLLGVSAAGVLLVNATGSPGLKVVAASSENSRLLEVLSVELSSCPGAECVHGGSVVSSPVIEADAGRWPGFARAAVGAGFRAVHALPMRLRGRAVGALTLLHTVPHALGEDDRHLAQGLADAATIGLRPRRAFQYPGTVAEQIRDALERRVVAEQATGILAQRSGQTVDEAAAVLREYARRHHRPLSRVCSDVVAGVLDLGAPA